MYGYMLVIVYIKPIVVFTDTTIKTSVQHWKQWTESWGVSGGCLTRQG